MQNSSPAYRRWLEMLCLSLAAGMLFWGHLILRPYLHGWGFICYWLGCFLFTAASILLALHDLVTICRRIRRDQTESRRQTLDEGRGHRVDHGGQSSDDQIRDAPGTGRQ